jgi:hypothetical protein
VTTTAYKFTRPGAVSPFRDFRWSPGEWAEVEGELRLCANGVHACRVAALPRWLDDELWRIELDEVQEEREGLLLARRGRLLERVAEWDAETSRELARNCAAMALEFADRVPDELVQRRTAMITAIAEGPDPSATALAMYTTAHMLDEVEPGSYYDERRRQAEWLRDRLRLADA